MCSRRRVAISDRWINTSCEPERCKLFKSCTSRHVTNRERPYEELEGNKPVTKNATRPNEFPH